MRPLHDGLCARLLHGILSDAHLAREASHRGGCRPPGVAKRSFDLRVQCASNTISGRTSIEPYLADGMVAAHRNAESRSSQSRM